MGRGKETIYPLRVEVRFVDFFSASKLMVFGTSLEQSNSWALRVLDLLNLEVGHKFRHDCTLRKTGMTHIGVSSITSLVANDEMIFKFVFFQSCQGILKLTDSQLGIVRHCKGR